MKNLKNFWLQRAKMKTMKFQEATPIQKKFISPIYKVPAPKKP